MGSYVVTAHRPSSVTHSVVGHFTNPADINLIIAKSTRIEIHKLKPDGLQGVADVPIYGRVATLKLFRPPGADRDLLFLSTERYKFCVLGYDEVTGELVTRANGDVQDRVGRPCDNGQLGIIDPECRMIGLHLYDGLFKVIPIDEQGQLHEAFNIRLEELTVIDIQFLHGTAKPTVALLYQDTKDARHIKTYELAVKEKDLGEGPWMQQNLDAGANIIIPVPAPLGGAIVLGESVIAYFSEDQPMKCTPIRQTILRAYGRVDDDGSRYLLGDHLGRLYLLVLTHDLERVVGLALESLGRTSAASTISYLDNGVVFVGSSFGDSQLVRLLQQPVGDSQPPSFLELVEAFPNLGPIVDMAVVDLDRQGQGQVVTCSGVQADGSLRIIRNGIGMIEQATVELPGIRGVWSLKASNMDAYDTYLVLTFVGETRVLAINADDELDEADIEGFDAAGQTLYCGSAVHEQLVQVTYSSVRLVDAARRQLVAEWKPFGGRQINVAAASGSQVLLASGEADLVYLEIGAAELTEVARVMLPNEIACLDISPLGDNTDKATLAAVGTWNMQLLVLALPSLAVRTTEILGGEVIARSVLFATFEGIPYLLCALGDGHLFNFQVEADSGKLSECKIISLGTKSITLKTFRSNGIAHVFAASDRPTVIYSRNKKLLYSNLNENEVNFMTSFNSASFPDRLAIAKEESMTIGTIDEIQKLHIRTVPLDDMEASFVRLLDDQTFETLDRFQLDNYEQACSLVATSFADDSTPYYVAGTAFALPDEQEPTKGRILVFRVRDKRLQVVCEKETRGAVYNANAFQGKLLAGINSRVQLYKWTQRDDGTRELSNECGHSGHVCALYVVTRGDFIVVGDIMKSIQLLVYKPEEGSIEVRARDYHSNWMTAVEVLDDDTYLGAENSFNLFTVRKNSEAAADDERNKLEVVGEYHLGEFVNRFRPGSLVMRLPDSESAKIPTFLFGTINGVIGVVACLPPDKFGLLIRLQTCLRGVVKGVGGLDHASWRSFSNERITIESHNFVDGDLIEQYLDLKRDAMERVAQQMGDGHTVEDLSRVVEELARLH